MVNNQDSLKKVIAFNPSPVNAEVDFIRYKDKEIPSTIYKYRSWYNKHHKRLLTNREVYFPPAVKLNDPFDSQRNFDWEELMDPEKHKRYVHIAAERVSRIRDFTQEQKEDFIDQVLKQNMTKESMAEMEQSIVDHDNFFNSLQGTFTASLIRDSILLWAHYADSHRGYCVGIDTATLLDSIKHGGHSQMAEYSSKLRLTSLLDDIPVHIGKKTFSKYDIWSYEFEYRILAGQLTNNKIFPPAEAFKEIIFGIYMSKEDKMEIIYRSKKQMPLVKFYQAKKAHNEYRIEIVPFEK